MSGQDLNPEQKLPYMEQTPSSFRAPEPVHAHLDELVGRAEDVKTSRQEVIAALVAACDLGEDDLAALVMAYRKAHESDIPITPPESTES